MKTLLYVLILIAPMLVFSQERPDLIAKEAEIKKTISANPEKAKALIKEILGDKGRLHDTVYANAYTSYGYYYHVKNNPDSSLYYYNKAETYTNGYPKHYATVLRRKAVAYRKKNDYSYSLKLLSIAENTFSSLGDEKNKALTYGDMAANYNMMLKSEEAIPYLLKAIAILEKENDKVLVLPIKQSLANTYLNMHNFEFAIDLYKDVLAGFKASNNLKNYCITLMNYGDCLFNTNRVADAKNAYTEAVAGLEKFGDNELVALTLSKLGKTEIYDRNHLQAEYYYNKAFYKALESNSIRFVRIAGEYCNVLMYLEKRNEAQKVVDMVDSHPVKNKANLEDKLYFENVKAKLFQNIKDDDKAVAALKNKLEILDTLNKTDNKIETIKLQQEFQKEYQSQKQNKLKTINTALSERVSENERSRTVPIVLLSGIFLVIVAVFGYKYSKHRKKILASRAQKKLLERQYEQEKYTHEELRNNLEDKEKELADNSMMMEQLQENINRIIALCNDKSRDSNPNDIKSIRKDLKLLISDKDYWKFFRKSFSETHTVFGDEMLEKFPKLTESDLFLCSLLRLKLSYKDIGVIMQVTPETIVKKKYRAKKRMGIDSEQEFDMILQSA